MDHESEGDRLAKATLPLEAEVLDAAAVEYMDVRRLMKAISDAFDNFFDGRVDEKPRDRQYRIGRFVKEEMSVHADETENRMKVHVDDVLEKDEDFPYNSV